MPDTTPQTEDRVLPHADERRGPAPLPVAGELPVTPPAPAGERAPQAEEVARPTADPSQRAEEVAKLASGSGRSVAVAESLTAGALSSALGAAPDSSAWFRGGVVAYASEVKHTLLQVPEGPVVSEQAAVAMAETTADLLGADVALGVTGAGGPDPQDGQPAGTVWLAVCVGQHTTTECRRFPGGPEDVVQQTVLRGLALLQQALATAAG
ncbi:nicotinamide-nucleotide amidohydrolase family protein [Phycicoccus sp. M110.8]|uniref:CinA family protein n=1 Tax=Phycicoccus sp. M110.8 TaxID=3075433 RepID=UPI0028FD0462|nr:nicotinamide-nucleotide amidohydrolase family protein [Phycicoccus sp. M110.8]MDU0315388.1 nicotinamide-nucleotide amidohydrolase family protein [Phycicoccus sp. M110.8]